MSQPSGNAPDSPDTGDVDTESLYGAAPEGAPDTESAEDAATSTAGTIDPSETGYVESLPEG